MSPEFMASTRTSLVRLPAGDGMTVTKLGLFLLWTSHTQMPASGSPPHGLLKVPV